MRKRAIIARKGAADHLARGRRVPRSSAQIAKLAESFGGKLEVDYGLPSVANTTEAIATLPHDVSAETQGIFFVRVSGNIAKTQSIPLMNAEEFKAAMEKVKNVKSTYTPPTATKQ